MSDPRLTPANARVVAAHLGDAPAGLVRVKGVARRLTVPVADLVRTPEGPRDRQLLFGESVTVLEDRAGWSFVQAERDGYVGYLPSAALGEPRQATHRVAAPATHIYERPDIKSPDRLGLSFGARVTALAETPEFAETAEGFVPRVHLRHLDDPMHDPAGVAALFLGTPYLWGGNSRAGIDCSGLVQAALLACGVPCPGDSDMQQALGRAVAPGQSARRGDLLFWKGHVALVADRDTLIHANAFHMAVALEPLAGAIARIAAQGGGPVIAHRRL